MLTKRDRQLQRDTGLISPDRLGALAHAYRCKAADLRRIARNPEHDERYAAALRGMATGYAQAARDVDRVMCGLALKPHRNSSARAKAIAARLRIVADSPVGGTQ